MRQHLLVPTPVGLGDLRTQFALTTLQATPLQRVQRVFEPERHPVAQHGADDATLIMRQRAFGYTDEDLKMILGPMAD